MKTKQKGNISSLSTIAVPGLLAGAEAAPWQAVRKQWTKLYHTGRSAMVKAAAVTLVSYLCAGYSMHSHSYPLPRVGGCLAAGGLTVGIVPYTFAMMMGTNNQLEFDSTVGVKGKGNRLSKKQTESLITRWKTLNAIRSLLPLAGAVVALWTLVG